MTHRVRKRGGLQKVGHTTMASAQNRLRGIDDFKEKLIRFNGYPKTYPMVVLMPIVSQ